jgi:hypothetical protein
MLIDQMADPATIKQIIDRMKILHNGGHAIQETISYCWPFCVFRVIVTGDFAKA